MTTVKKKTAVKKTVKKATATKKKAVKKTTVKKATLRGTAKTKHPKHKSTVKKVSLAKTAVKEATALISSLERTVKSGKAKKTSVLATVKKLKLRVSKAKKSLGGTAKKRTKASVIKDYPQYKSLINAVIKQTGMENLSYIANHGIDGGYRGFISYAETHAFAIKNRKQIVYLLEEQADSMGEDVVEMVSGFGVFRRSKMDKDDKKDLYNYLGGGKVTQGTITNTMAWFAGEEVARMFENN